MCAEIFLDIYIYIRIYIYNTYLNTGLQRNILNYKIIS